LQVKPQERKELCGGREGQTAYYVERKALRCGARKATLISNKRLVGSSLRESRGAFFSSFELLHDLSQPTSSHLTFI